MKGYRKLKNNDQVKLEEFGDDVRVLQSKFDENTGEKIFGEVLVTNTIHLDDLERDANVQIEIAARTLADLKSNIAGIRALRSDVKTLTATRRREKKAAARTAKSTAKPAKKAKLKKETPND